MFGKGAGSLPTASSILSDMVAHRHGYRYEYKKMGYADVPVYTTDILLKVYVRYSKTPIPEVLPFASILERYSSETVNYVIGEISIKNLMKHRETLDHPDVFIVNISRFFEDKN